MTNFKTPYLATSFRNFWHRWHISLSTWFRDYIYIPLGGNRSSFARWAINIFLTFMISGLWHGANITFLVWGSIHGILYILERYLSPVFHLPGKIKNRLGWLLTFLLVNISWMFFRASSWQQVGTLFAALNLKDISIQGSFLSVLYSNNSFTAPGRMLLFIFPFFILSEFFMKEQAFDEMVKKLSRPLQVSIFYFLILIILFFGVLNSAPQFIYFQF